MSDKYYDSWGNEYVKVASGGGLVGLLFFIAIVWAVVKYVSSISEEIATAILAVAAIGSLVLSILCVVRHLRVYGYFSSAFIIFLVCLLIQIFEWDGFGNALLICFISLFAFATANGMKKAMIACFVLWLLCGFGSDTTENVNITSRILQVMIPVYMLHLIMNEKGRKLIPFLFVVSLLLFSYPYIASQILYGKNMFSLPEILYDQPALFAILLFIFGYLLKRPALALYPILVLVLLSALLEILLSARMITSGYGSIFLPCFSDIFTLLGAIPLQFIQDTLSSLVDSQLIYIREGKYLLQSNFSLEFFIFVLASRGTYIRYRKNPKYFYVE